MPVDDEGNQPYLDGQPGKYQKIRDLYTELWNDDRDSTTSYRAFAEKCLELRIFTEEELRNAEVNWAIGEVKHALRNAPRTGLPHAVIAGIQLKLLDACEYEDLCDAVAMRVKKGSEDFDQARKMAEFCKRKYPRRPKPFVPEILGE